MGSQTWLALLLIPGTMAIAQVRKIAALSEVTVVDVLPRCSSGLDLQPIHLLGDGT